jgi:intein/homing endonuclease
MTISNEIYRKQGNTPNVVTIVDPKSGKEISYFLEGWIKNRFDKKVIPDLEKKDKDCVIAIDGKEGCLFEDTLIKTNKGDKKIKELCDGKSFIVESLDIKNDKKVFSKAICIDSGIKELFEIATEDGRKVKATADHTFFIKRGKRVCEIKLSDLKEGDELICQ